MCYIVLLATTSDDDLARHNTTLLHFARDIPTTGAAAVEATALRHPHRWYVGSSAGCSCSFRHLYSVELGFDEPADWYPEEAEDIQATLQFIQVVRALVAEGHAEDQDEIRTPTIRILPTSLPDASARAMTPHWPCWPHDHRPLPLHYARQRRLLSRRAAMRPARFSLRR